jgi:cytochrome c-type biogenesis protein CcmE
MKTRYWIGSVLAVLFIAIGIMALNNSKIEYGTLSAARESGRKMQVKGVWVKDKGAEYDSHANTFAFTMKDEKGDIVPVMYNGARPNNFDIAESIVVKGKYQGNTFMASEILTKCPSKYEGNAEQLRSSGTQ